MRRKDGDGSFAPASATYFLRAEKVGKDAPEERDTFDCVPLLWTHLPATTKGGCGPPLDSPGVTYRNSKPRRRPEGVPKGELVPPWRRARRQAGWESPQRFSRLVSPVNGAFWFLFPAVGTTELGPQAETSPPEASQARRGHKRKNRVAGGKPGPPLAGANKASKQKRQLRQPKLPELSYRMRTK